MVNPSARTRSGLVELQLPGHEPIAGAQVLLVANGSPTASGAPGARDPGSPGWGGRIFVTYQHGANNTFELFPGATP